MSAIVGSRQKIPLKYDYTEKTVLEGWASKYESAKTYLATLNGRQESAALSLFFFCDWAKINPDQLIALKSDRNRLEAERLLDRLKDAKVKFPDKRKWHVVQIVRGFFRTNYCALEPQAGRSMRYNPGEPHTLPSKEKRLALYKAARNPRDRALVIVDTCSALALETLSKVCWHHFEENWESQEIPNISLPSELIKGHGKGKYQGVKQVTFITPEAKAALMEYREDVHRTLGYKWKPTDHVFISVKRNIGEPLSKRALSKRATVLEKRAGVGFSFHDGRRIAQTALENAGCPLNWIKKIKGRKVSGEESPYSRPMIEQLREYYKKALKDLEFLNAGSENFRKITDDYEVLKKEHEELKRRQQETDALVTALYNRQMEKHNQVSETLKESGKTENIDNKTN